jgi:polyisoprenoid-binding protein YceI
MNKRIVFALGLALAIPSLAACDNNPAKDKAVAQVAAPTAVAAPQKGGITYKIASPDSKLQFVGAKLTGKHDGEFTRLDGTIQLVDGDPTKSSVSVDVDTASVKTDADRLTGHLKTAEFFDVEKFPRAHFVSTSIKTGGEKGATHTVTGNLELHGVTKSITFPASIRAAGDKVEVDAEFAINRKDFGLVYPGKPDDLIKDEVLIKLTLRAPKNS